MSEPEFIDPSLRSFFDIRIKYRASVLQAAPPRNEDRSDRTMQLKIEKPDDTNFILGQTH